MPSLCFLCCKPVVDQTFRLSVMLDLKTPTWRYCNVKWTTLPTFRRYNFEGHLLIENIGNSILVTQQFRQPTTDDSISSGNGRDIKMSRYVSKNWHCRFYIISIFSIIASFLPNDYEANISSIMSAMEWGSVSSFLWLTRYLKHAGHILAWSSC